VVVNILKINFLTPYTANCSVFRVKRPLGCQYYCKILLPLINIAQRFSLDDSVLLCNILFCSWVRTRKYVEWYWCCLCGHCFSTVFNKRKESILDQRVVRRPQYTYERLMTDLILQWAKKLQFFLSDSTLHYLTGHSRELSLRSLKKHYHTRRVAFSQHVFITLRYLATGNNVEDLKLLKVTSQSTGIIVLETCLLLNRRTATEWILRSIVYRPFNTLCNPSLLPIAGQ